MDANTRAGLKFIELNAVITRACHKEGCPYFETQDCPKHVKYEDKGTIAFWHRNPLKRLAYKFGRFVQGQSAGSI